MSAGIGRKEDCPWKNSAKCPLAASPQGGGPVLNVRVDADLSGMMVCACQSSGSESPALQPSSGLRSASAAGSPYLEAVENPFRKIGPEEWTVLQGMLRNPISGLSALGLALFPERLQDHFLDSIQQGGTANVRLNLEPSAVSPDRLSVLALRALCQETGAKLYVDEADAVLPASGEPQYLMSGTASWRPRPTSP